MMEAADQGRIAELQGLYGPLRILEQRVQQVWALQQVQPGEWRTRGGARLRVRSPGRWNRGAGPDFREAVLEFDGAVRMGDIEVHLYREDWWRHGHHTDPAYNSVILHVVLFAGGMEQPMATLGGAVPEEWVMGPWMREDVEAISGGEPGLYGELVPELREWIEAEPPDLVRERLRVGADRRWQDKEAMARCLHGEHGWTGGLHRMVLYYMGFPANRRAFYEMAEAYPPECWQRPELYGLLTGRWAGAVRWGAGRPANRPGRRLQEYMRLCAGVPDWTQRLQAPDEALLSGLSRALCHVWQPGQTGALRRQAGFGAWRNWLTNRVLGGVFCASLADRLWVDVFLPMLVVDGRLEREEAVALWFHSQPALYPDAYRPLLALAGVGVRTGSPWCNGWVQGMLWAEDQLRLERVRGAR